MSKEEVAREVLACLGGSSNVLTNTVCMTRLRVTLRDPQAVDYEQLGDVHGVLGTALRGSNGLEVVFGPRVIDGIYHAFVDLTGIAAGTDALFPMSRQESNIRVQIRSGGRTSKTAPAKPAEPPLIADSELSVLQDLFNDDVPTQAADEAAPAPTARLMVLNGPNINMLGIQDTQGSAGTDFPSLLQLCKDAAQQAGFARCDCFQSNHEGDLVDKIQDAHGTFDALVINPGAYGTSAALRGALEAVSVPAVEVHLVKRSKRDAVGMACLKMVSGHDVDGYTQAIALLARHLDLRGEN